MIINTILQLFVSVPGKRKKSGQVDVAMLYNAQPTESEMELFDEVQIVLTEASDVLSDLKHYLGADQYIRAAINNPSAEQNALTWEALMPRIRTLRQFYFFSQKI
ncbi:protein FAM49B-like [Acyrthosiphon pisum]|uniref:CYRIA/CYRIB Rac1 binding domain-containing protein n=1 Tax=Acyrthosiphon pisum TaxID=7029 RepID=A0A8R2D551_ACYPI|nr:protein FAM49B-like [Acyrthosiphon pisum]XP_029347424.1 protein FAM49B-like [Acyrthosiphon pisum]|eukprot:XP_016661050.1 PREDICTED: protein FAM49B-like [Acyrthosiphon pisum]